MEFRRRQTQWLDEATPLRVGIVTGVNFAVLLELSLSSCLFLILFGSLFDFAFLVDLKQIAASGTYHLTVVESSKALDSLRQKLLGEVNLSDDLGVLQSTHDENDYALQVIRRYK